jgi:hypothetical protein
MWETRAPAATCRNSLELQLGNPAFCHYACVCVERTGGLLGLPLNLIFSLFSLCLACWALVFCTRTRQRGWKWGQKKTGWSQAGNAVYALLPGIRILVAHHELPGLCGGSLLTVALAPPSLVRPSLCRFDLSPLEQVVGLSSLPLPLSFLADARRCGHSQVSLSFTHTSQDAVHTFDPYAPFTALFRSCSIRS